MRAFLVAIAAVLLIQFSPSLLDFEPKYHNIVFPKSEGPYAHNDLLSKAKRVHEDVLVGPEALAVGPDGHIYTGLLNGHIVRLVGEKVEDVAKVGTKDCAKEAGTRTDCGRPLGLRFGKDGLLYVADAFMGLLAVNVASGKVTQLVPLHKEVGGKNITFPDDLDIDKNGVIYFSDGSTKWNLDNFMYSVLERQSDGRVLKYDPKTKKVTVVVDGIVFANGVQLADENSLLICESDLHRIIRYYHQGPKKGQNEVFVDELPGFPDNIRPSSSGGYWVGIVAPRNDTNRLTIDILLDHPTILRLFVRAFHLAGSVANFLGNLFPCQCLKDWAHQVHSGKIFSFDSGYSMAVEVNKDGKALRSLMGPSQTYGHISHILEHKGSLYLGSFVNRFLSILK